jgi:hypothetical protein
LVLYFVGVFGLGSGLAGVFSVVFVFLSSMMEWPPRGMDESLARTREVTMNMIAATVVNLARNVPGPRPPKKDSEAAPPAPKTPDKPAPLPVCNRTIAIIAIANTTCAPITMGWNMSISDSFAGNIT